MFSLCRLRCLLSAACLAALWPSGPAAAGEPSGQEAAKGAQASGGESWENLFDGRSLGKWKVIDEFDFAHHGKVRVADGAIVMEMGSPATGVKWTGPFPKKDYEITLQGKRVEGDDFFCSMTFPVGEKSLTLVVGGWSGQIVGLSSINDEPAIENETCQFKDFKRNQWYRVRLRVTTAKIEAWIDDEKLVDLGCENRKFTLYWEMEPMLPFGIATWNTTGAVRDIRLRKLKAKSQESRALNPKP